MRMVVGLLGAEKNFVLSGKDRGNVFTSFVRTAGNRLMRSQMTDREPFMKKECGGVRIGEGVWINLGENGTPYNLGRVVHEANAAFNKRLDEEIAKAKASRDGLREALERSRMAIDDWLHSYAPEFCDEDSVAQTRSRISEKGTLGYIADVQKQNHETLSADEEIAKVVWVQDEAK